MRVLIDRLKRWFEPWQVREERRRAERKALLAAVNARLKPRIRELGFSSARTEAWRGSRFKSWLSGWGFIRMRDDRVDLLEISWDKHGGALFRILFASQRLEDWEAIRWGEAYKFGRVAGASAEAPRPPEGRAASAVRAGRHGQSSTIGRAIAPRILHAGVARGFGCTMKPTMCATMCA